MVDSIQLGPRPYAHRPLGPTQIRVITLKAAADFSSPLHCDIQHVPLETANHCALSYTWGQPVFSQRLLVSDGEYVIGITENLDLALRRLRGHDAELNVWVDAVCINQSDVEEKNAQIRLMSRIYKTAERVLAWIGPDNEACDGGRCLRRFGEVAFGSKESNSSQDDTSEGGGSSRKCLAYYTESAFDAFMRGSSSERGISLLEPAGCSPPPPPLSSRGKGLAPAFSPTDHDLADRLLTRAYFSRRWIVQEVALANVRRLAIFCGDTEVSGESFITAMHIMENIRLHHGTSTDILKPVMAMLRAFYPTPIGLLWDFVGFKCQDDRDHVLSQLAVFEEIGLPSTETRFLSASYASPVAEVYTTLAEYQLDCQHQNTLCVAELLVVSCSIRGAREDTPSWVPDWRCAPKFRVSEMNPGAPVQMRSANRWRILEDMLPSHDRVPLCNEHFDIRRDEHGAYLDERELHARLGPARLSAGRAELMNGTWKRRWTGSRGLRPQYLAKRRLATSCLEIWGLQMDTVCDCVDASDLFTVAGRAGFRIRTRDWPCSAYYLSVCGSMRSAVSETVATHASNLHRNLSGWLLWHKTSLLDDLDGNVEDTYELQQFMEQLPDTMRGRSLFRTARGYIGVCGSDVRPGDTVAVFLECPAAFVLRCLPGSTTDHKTSISYTGVSKGGLFGPYKLISDTYIHGFNPNEFVDCNPMMLLIL